MVHAGSPSVVGNFNVTFFLEPSRATGATQCLVFKSVPGTVAGVPTSGTWTSPTFPGWKGQWIQLGDHVRFFGVTSSGLSTAASGNMEYGIVLGGVSFNHYSSATGATSSAGSFRANRVANCPTSVSNKGGDDPAGKIVVNTETQPVF
jgi:hypothetical protein